MKNLKKSFVGILAMIMPIITANAITYPSSDYEISSGGTLNKWYGNETEIDLTADTYLREHVEEIGEYAFSDCSTLKKIKLTSTVTYVSIYAFQDCKELETVEFSEDGFHNDLRHIDEGAFRNCTNLKTVIFSKYVKSFNGDAYENCPSLTTFKFNGTHPDYISSSGAIYSKDRTQLVLFPPGITGHLDLDSKVTSIEDNAFYNSALTSVYMENGVQSIGKSAFYNAYNLTTINFPNTLIRICDSAFSKCGKLKTLILPSSLESIEAFAFSRCSSLPETIKLPASLYFMDGSAFERCDNVKNFTVDNNNPYLTTVDGALYDSYLSELKAWPYGRDEVEITIPQGITSIAEKAFYFSKLQIVNLPSTLCCIKGMAFARSFLKKIIIPEGVTDISDAFRNCDELEVIELPSTLQDLNRYAFRRLSSEIKQRTYTCHALSPFGEWLPEVSNDILYVPEESLELYKMAKYWRDFGEILPIPVIQNYKVTYDAPDYGILIVAADGDEIESGSEVAEGSSISVLAIPFPGYQVRSIVVNGVDMDDNVSFKIKEHTHISANFVSEQELGIYTVDGNLNLEDIYSVSGIKQNALMKGVTVVRRTDGTTVKIFK